MDDERREEIEERAALLPKPWHLMADVEHCEVWEEGELGCIVADCGTEVVTDFIANAPADIHDLLADNAALEQKLARALAALGKLEPDYIASDEDGDYCEWCGSDSGHIDDCVFAVIAKAEGEE